MSASRPPRRDTGRDRDAGGRARSARPRDTLGRPLPRGDAAAPPTPDPPALPPPDALREAQRLLDADRPFQAHEVLEAVWKGPDTAAEERQLWRGLAQLAVGVTHYRRGNRTGARALLTRAADTLAAYSGTSPHAVRVDDLRSWARTVAGRPEDAANPTGIVPPRLT